jgi:hypothetical protein
MQVVLTTYLPPARFVDRRDASAWVIRASNSAWYISFTPLSFVRCLYSCVFHSCIPLGFLHAKLLQVLCGEPGEELASLPAILHLGRTGSKSTNHALKSVRAIASSILLIRRSARSCRPECRECGQWRVVAEGNGGAPSNQRTNIPVSYHRVAASAISWRGLPHTTKERMASIRCT